MKDIIGRPLVIGDLVLFELENRLFYGTICHFGINYHEVEIIRVDCDVEWIHDHDYSYNEPFSVWKNNIYKVRGL